MPRARMKWYFVITPRRARKQRELQVVAPNALAAREAVKAEYPGCTIITTRGPVMCIRAGT